MMSDSDSSDEQQLSTNTPGDAAVEECLKAFDAPDAVMSPAVIEHLAAYAKTGAPPVQAVKRLSQSYIATAQKCNILCEWMSMLSDDSDSTEALSDYVVNECERQLAEYIAPRFDAQKADRIFEEEAQQTWGVAWLTELVAHAKWRQLMYQLADKHGDCLLLTFGVKLCSDAGYDSEITSVRVAARQTEVYSRVVIACVRRCLELACNGDVYMTPYAEALEQLIKMSAFSPCTYLYTQTLLSAAALQCDREAARALEALSREIGLRVCERNSNAVGIHMAIERSRGLCDEVQPDATKLARACAAVGNMLAARQLNAADVHTLYELYVRPTTRDSKLPLSLLQQRMLIDMLIDAIYRPNAPIMEQGEEKLQQHVYVLAYVATACDSRTSIAGEETRERRVDGIDAVARALQQCASLCHSRDTSILNSELQTAFDLSKRAVCARALVHWVKCRIYDPDFANTHPEPVPHHLLLLDEIADKHRTLHAQIFDIYAGLLVRHESAEERQSGLLEQSAALAARLQIQAKGASEQLLIRQRAIIDRCVHLSLRGHVMPILEWLRQQLSKNTLDTSLLRYYVHELMNMITPPYSEKFTRAFLPLAANKQLIRSGDSGNEEIDTKIAQFIEQAMPFIM